MTTRTSFKAICKRFAADERGIAGSVYALLITVAAGLLILFASEWMRMIAVQASLRDLTESAILSLAQENWDETYRTRREGYSGAYATFEGVELNDGSGVWFTQAEYLVNGGELSNRVGGSLKAAQDGGYWSVRDSRGKYQYRFNVAGVSITGPSLKSGTAAYTSPSFHVDVTLDVYMGTMFNWGLAEWHFKPVRVRASYRPKF